MHFAEERTNKAEEIPPTHGHHEYNAPIRTVHIPPGHPSAPAQENHSHRIGPAEGEPVRTTAHVLDKLPSSFHIWAQGARSLGAV